MQGLHSERRGQGRVARRQGAERTRPVPRIMLIEHSRVDRILVGATLMLKGRAEIKLTEVADLDLALTILLQRSYDLVLLDDAMPGYSPSEVTRAVRAVAPNTPIVRHRGYLEEITEDTNGLDTLVEAVETALGGGGARVRPSSALAPWSASAVS